MNRKIRVRPPAPGFVERIRKTLDACGFDLAAEGAPADGAECDEVAIYEVRSAKDAAGIAPFAEEPREGGQKPFLIYTEIDLGGDYVSRCRAAGLVGVLRDGMEPEETAFLLNKAIYCEKMLFRNPRAPVRIPVVASSGLGTLNTIASQLSRDGMFIITLSPLEPRSVCAIEFDVPGAGGPMKTRGRVIYSVEVNTDLSIISIPSNPFKRLVMHPGMAVYFLDLDDGARAVIDQYIETLC